MTATADVGSDRGGDQPLVSLVVLAWDNLPLTQACVGSLRATTDVPYELIVVDNGSAPEAAAWARDHADVAVLHEENLGFARGMNAGLQAASGKVVAFVNNDTTWPDGWSAPLLEHFRGDGPVGIVCPAVDAAGNPVTVRDEPGSEVIVLDPFSALPSGVAYLMRTEVARALGGWTERYDVAMSEDLDLCFTCWVNRLDVVIDTRVLVHHELHATLDAKLGAERVELWRQNLDRFLEVWTTTDGTGIGRLPDMSDTAFARELAHARAAATWLERLDAARRRHRKELRELRAKSPRPAPPQRSIARRLLDKLAQRQP